MIQSGLRVCHVFAGTEGGSWVFDQLVRLRDQGCEVTALLGGDSGTLVERCRDAGLRTVAFDFTVRPTLALALVPWRFLKLALWMRRERFDVVQSHVINSTIFARPAAWLADVPVRLTMVTGPFYMQAPATRMTESATCIIETGIIPSCELTAQLYREAGVPERLICETLYYGPAAALFDPATSNPLGLRATLGLPADTLLIGVVAMFYQRLPATGARIPPATRGRLVKGHEDLIAAMPLILEQFPQARMLFIGKGWGPQAPQCEAEIAELIAAAGMADHILPIGFVADVAGAYLDLDVSVQASLNENLGGTVESLLMARPTVATRVGGMVDAVVDGKTGVVVNPSDPPSLAHGIAALLMDSEWARALGQAGRARMLADFTIDVTAPRLMQIYTRQRAAATGAWRLSRLVLRTIWGPLRFGHVMAWVVLTSYVVPYGQAYASVLLNILARLPRKAAAVIVPSRHRPGRVR